MQWTTRVDSNDGTGELTVLALLAVSALPASDSHTVLAARIGSLQPTIDRRSGSK